MKPPRAALWLVDQFAPPDRRVAILGDLQEEFALIAAKKGIPSAWRWCWWQTARTLVHLNPARLLLSVALGFFLWWNVPMVIAGAVAGIHNRWQVYNYMDAYSFWLIYAILVQNVIAPALVGSLLALWNKGRESIASVGLAVTVLVHTVFALVQHVFAQQNFVSHNPGLRSLWHAFTMMQFQMAAGALLTALSLVIGGWIVRKARVADAIRPAGA